jgi:hypothetical protein
MADVYFFLFTKADVSKDGQTVKGFTKEQAIERMKTDGVDYVGMIDNDDLTLFTVKEKPEHEETTRLVMLTPTMFALIQDLEPEKSKDGDSDSKSDDDEKHTPTPDAEAIVKGIVDDVKSSSSSPPSPLVMASSGTVSCDTHAVSLKSVLDA